MLLRAQLTFGVLCLLSAGEACAVPSFARQTGLSCNVCHSNPPELTAFGRNFKLKGYVLTDMTDKDKGETRRTCCFLNTSRSLSCSCCPDGVKDFSRPAISPLTISMDSRSPTPSRT